MKATALEGQRPLLIMDDITPPAACMFCGKPRPLELTGTHMCTACKRKALWQLFWIGS
jgi:hypothetical protein